MLAGAGPAGNRGPANGTAGEFNIHLDRGIATRIDDFTGVNGNNISHENSYLLLGAGL